MQLASEFILSAVDFFPMKIGIENQIALYFKKLFVTFWHQKVKINFKPNNSNRTSGYNYYNCFRNFKSNRIKFSKIKRNLSRSRGLFYLKEKTHCKLFIYNAL